MNEFDEYAMALAWYAIRFLSIYRKNRKAVDVKKVRLGGEAKKQKHTPMEWDFTSSRVISEIVPENDTSSTAAFDVSGLIPPADRIVQIVAAGGNHASPVEHWVKGHTRVYWTGPGRTIPVVKEISPYKRGRQVGEEPSPRTRVCEEKAP